MQDLLGDMITRIRNGHRAQLGAVLLHPETSYFCVRILRLLSKEGYIRGFQYEANTKNKKAQIKVLLKYDSSGVPAIQTIFKISKSGRKVYSGLNALWKPKNTFGSFVISTPIGLMFEREARYKNVGGEILFGLY